MNDQRNFQSTKFSLLTVEEEPKGLLKKKFFWICISIFSFVIIIISLFLYWKIFLISYENQKSVVSNKRFIQVSESNDVKSFNKSLFSPRIWKPGEEKQYSELFCLNAESQHYLPAIFDPYSKENLKISLSNIYDFIHKDLLLHYDYIINKYNKKYLKNIFENYQKQIKKSKTLFEFLLNLKSEKFKLYVKYLIETNSTRAPGRLQSIIAVTNEFCDWYSYLENLKNFLYMYRQQKQKQDLFRNILYKNFTKFTTLTQEVTRGTVRTFTITEKKIKEINEVLSEWISPPSVSFLNSLLVIHNKVLLTSEVNDHLKTINNSSIKSLFVFASHTIYLDEDIKLPGVNLVIISPNWIFSKKIKIDVSGANGIEFESKAAFNGTNGKPGNPGNNSGDFIGVGNINERFLVVFANGGNGGNGQDGSNGRNGEDGTQPEPAVGKPTCVDKIGAFKNSFQELISHYKIFSEKGCGQPGSDGGTGGIGGKGGKITIINTDKKEVTIGNGFNGSNGLPGKGGEGGKGGRDGCFYEVFDIDDKTLYSITTVKCERNILPSSTPGNSGVNTEGLKHPDEKKFLTFQKPLYDFFSIVKKDLEEHNETFSFKIIKELIQDSTFYRVTNSCSDFQEYDAIQKLNRIDLLLILNSKIEKCLKATQESLFSYLKTLVLGKIMILQRNKHYYSIDINSHLSGLEKNIKEMNDSVKSYKLSPVNNIVKIKMEKIGRKLSEMKSELKTLDWKSNKSAEKFLLSTTVNDQLYDSIAVVLGERRFASITQILTDLMIRFVTQNQNPPFIRENFKNFLARYSLYYNEMLRKKKEFFNSLNDFSSSEKQILSQIIISPREFQKHAKIIKKVIKFLPDFSQEERKMVKILEDFYDETKFLEEIKEIIEGLRSKVVSAEGRSLLEELDEEVDHLIILNSHLQWEEMEKSFLHSLNLLNISREFDFLKKEVQKICISIKYTAAVDAVQLKVYPLKDLESHLLSSENFANEALTHINQLKVISKQTPICKNFREAIFDKTSVLGEFYFWPNSLIKNKMKKLFRGEKIFLKSDLNNRNVLDKNFIKFKTIKFEFETESNSLKNLLNNFQIEITHLGYSHYNWRGDRKTVITEEITLEYGFKCRNNGEPELYNALFKKLQHGDIMLSPYTTWTIRLLPINNAASFDQLMPFSNLTDIRLTGTGTYIS